MWNLCFTPLITGIFKHVFKTTAHVKCLVVIFFFFRVGIFVLFFLGGGAVSDIVWSSVWKSVLRKMYYIWWTLIITNSLGLVKLLCYIEIQLYLGCKNNKIQRNFELWDQENYFVISGFCYISVLYITRVHCICQLTRMCNFRWDIC